MLARDVSLAAVQRVAEAYLRLNDNGRRRFLLMIALEFGPDPARVAKAHEAYQAAVGSAGHVVHQAEHLLAASVKGPQRKNGASA